MCATTTNETKNNCTTNCLYGPKKTNEYKQMWRHLSLFEMAGEKGNAWPNRKDDYELRDVIGEQLNIQQ